MFADGLQSVRSAAGNYEWCRVKEDRSPVEGFRFDTLPARRFRALSCQPARPPGIPTICYDI